MFYRFLVMFYTNKLGDNIEPNLNSQYWKFFDKHYMTIIDIEIKNFSNNIIKDIFSPFGNYFFSKVDNNFNPIEFFKNFENRTTIDKIQLSNEKLMLLDKLQDIENTVKYIKDNISNNNSALEYYLNKEIGKTLNSNNSNNSKIQNIEKNVLSHIYIKPIISLYIDKQNGDIAFNEQEHKYWNVKTNEFYKSVTGIIKPFIKPFDTDYFSKYEAIKRIKTNTFDDYKNKCGGYKNVVSNFEFEMNNIEKIKYEKLTIDVQKEWLDKSNKSSNQGTQIHKYKENLVKENNTYVYGGLTYQVLNKPKHYDLLEKKAYIIPEVLVYSHTYKLAGQIDLLMLDLSSIDKTFILADYKTNEKIDMQNNYNKMLSPLNHLDDCDYNKFNLQLNLYSFLVQETFNKDLICEKMDIIHLKQARQESVFENMELTEKIIPCKFMIKELKSILAGLNI